MVGRGGSEPLSVSRAWNGWIASLEVFEKGPGKHLRMETEPEDTQQEKNVSTHSATSLHDGRIRRLTGIWIATLALLTLSAAPALAHSQTVQPPSKEIPVVAGPISNPWAQAHCKAQAPAVVADASSGVVTFSPQGHLPCPPVANPGGQVHP